MMHNHTMDVSGNVLPAHELSRSAPPSEPSVRFRTKLDSGLRSEVRVWCGDGGGTDPCVGRGTGTAGGSDVGAEVGVGSGTDWTTGINDGSGMGSSRCSG